MNKIIVLIFLAFIPFSFLNAQSDTLLIRKHLTTITKTKGYRHFMNIELLNKTADYIFSDFQKYADTTYFQEFEVNGLTYKNVVCVFEPTLINSSGHDNSKTIVVGAHYDVCGMQEGADDNASGVVGLLELARLLKGQQFSHRIEIVAYSLEEPPYFRSENMGSFVHAKLLSFNNTDVYGMICLETIAYFKDEKKTQDYPLPLLRLFYGNRGNFITLVNKFGKGKFSKKFTKNYKRSDIIKTKKFNGPKALPGVDFSDHLNYWKFGYSALMITDTAFYRNKNYHEQGDVLESLDINRMAKVIDGVLYTILGL